MWQSLTVYARQEFGISHFFLLYAKTASGRASLLALRLSRNPARPACTAPTGRDLEVLGVDFY